MEIKQQGLLYFVTDWVKRMSPFFQCEESALDWCIENNVDL